MDIIALYGPRHADIEVKASPKATFRPGQLETLNYLRKQGNSFVFVAYPENWEEIKDELLLLFFS